MLLSLFHPSLWKKIKKEFIGKVIEHEPASQLWGFIPLICRFWNISNWSRFPDDETIAIIYILNFPADVTLFPFVPSSKKPHPAAALFHQRCWIFTCGRRQALSLSGLYCQIYSSLYKWHMASYRITGVWAQTLSYLSFSFFTLTLSLSYSESICWREIQPRSPRHGGRGEGGGESYV